MLDSAPRPNIPISPELDNFMWYDQLLGTNRYPVQDVISAYNWASAQTVNGIPLLEANGCAVLGGALTFGFNDRGLSFTLQGANRLMHRTLRDQHISGERFDVAKISSHIPLSVFSKKLEGAERFILILNPGDLIHLVAGLALPYKDESSRIAKVRNYAVLDTGILLNGTDGWFRPNTPVAAIHELIGRYYQGIPKFSDGDHPSYLKVFTS